MNVKRVMLPVVAVAATLSFAGVARAAPGPLLCFSGQGDAAAGFPGSNGTCKDNGTSFLINTVDGDSDPNNAYGGVYQQASTNANKRLRNVSELHFSYSGGPLAGGSPRFSLAIDADGNGAYDYFAFIDAIGCSGGTPTSGQTTSGTVDPINDPTCTVEANGTTYPSWAAFVASTPTTARIAPDSSQLSFIIVDQPGQFTLSNIDFGSPGRGTGGGKPGTTPGK